MVGRDIRSLRAPFVSVRSRHQTPKLGARKLMRPLAATSEKAKGTLHMNVLLDSNGKKEIFARTVGKAKGNVQGIPSPQAINSRSRLDNSPGR